MTFTPEKGGFIKKLETYYKNINLELHIHKATNKKIRRLTFFSIPKTYDNLNRKILCKKIYVQFERIE